MTFVSVDPGLHGCGVATWKDTALTWASYVKNPGTAAYSMVGAVDTACAQAGEYPAKLVIELPQVYVRSRSKGDPNDLIILACLVGAFEYRSSHRLEKTQLYKPAEWKGQVSKEITEHRAKKRLTQEELNHVHLPAAKGLRHNVWDAIGLGLHHLNR